MFSIGGKGLRVGSQVLPVGSQVLPACKASELLDPPKIPEKWQKKL